MSKTQIHPRRGACLPPGADARQVRDPATVPMTTQRDLSPGLFARRRGPLRGDRRESRTAYDYTNKGNLVAVISNGTAVLGLGNLGALAPSR